MVDTRFFPYAGPIELADLLAAAGHTDIPPAASGLMVLGASDPEEATSGTLVLAAQKAFAERLQGSKASVAIVAPELVERVPAGMLAIPADDPHDLFVSILERLYPDTERYLAAGCAATGVFAKEDHVAIGPGARVCEGAEIGTGTVIGANTVIGPGVTIGRNSVIGDNVTIKCAHLGDKVVVHSGARIGTAGFGWLDFGQRNRSIPQLGRVIVQDRVEIGANSTIDRGALADTVIGENTKIDNLVQVGHNCRLGRNCLVAAMSGLSGGTVLGDGVLLGGGVGTSGHLSVGTGSVVHGRAAVTKDWPEGSMLAGAPAQDIKGFWRELAALRRLARGDKA